MERAVGEVFDFNGAKLQVKDTGQKVSCDGCYFDEFSYYAVFRAILSWVFVHAYTTAGRLR